VQVAGVIIEDMLRSIRWIQEDTKGMSLERFMTERWQQLEPPHE
jgi:hypothetical protein